MKKIISILAFVLFAIVGQTQLTGVVVESTTDGSFICHGGGMAFPQPAGTTTYRVYAELNDATDFLSAQFAIAGCYPMNYSTTTTFFNDAAFGETIGASYISALCFAFPDSGYDSWMTIGVADNGTAGASVDEAWIDPVDPLGAAFGPGNGNMVVNDGILFTTSGNVAGMPVGPNNRVLLGQFTTDGDFSFDVNLNILDEGDGNTGNLQYLASSDLSCSDLAGTVIDGTGLGLVYSPGYCNLPGACNYVDNENEDLINNALCEYESCSGCTNNTFCDYDPTATIDDGSCGTACAGCTDAEAANYDDLAIIDDGSCVYIGCTNPLADNYDENADLDDGSCVIFGCIDNTACNYDALATDDDGNCIYVCSGCTDENAANYDPTATIDDGSCTDSILQVRNEVYYSDDGTVVDYPEGATTYRIYANIADGYTMSAVYAEAGCADFYIRTTTSFWNSPLGGITMNEIIPALFVVFPSLEYDSYVSIGVPGLPGNTNVISSLPADPYTGSLTGIGGNLEMEDGAWFALSDQPNVQPDENGDVLIGQFTTTGDISYRLNIQLIENGSGGIEFYSGCNEVTNFDIGLIYPLELCNLPGACNYAGNLDEDLINNATCEYESCSGCTDPESCYFDASATIDDGSCDAICFGCTDESAFNFSEQADEDDGSCLFAGCEYPNANNYNPDAELVGLEYCDIDGCTDNTAVNYNMLSNGSGECVYDCDNEILLEMEDTFNDGWDENFYIITDSDGNLIASGNLDGAAVGDGSSIGLQAICLTSGEYTIELVEGLWSMEVLWSISCTGGETISGGSPSVTNFSITDQECVLGCTNPEADNYNEFATIDYNCVFSGCTNPIADNYSDVATIDDGSCVFMHDGYVFYDANSNGEFDTQFDYGIAYQNLLLTPGDILATTDESGYYNFGELPEGDYTINLLEHPNYPTSTTPESLSFSYENGGIHDYNFGLTNEEAAFAIAVDFYPWTDGYPCNDFPSRHSICFRNMGNMVIDGYVEVEYDELFNGHTEITPINNSNGNTVQMEFEDLYPGEMFFYEISLLTPGVDAIGEILTSMARVYAYEGGELVAFGEEELSMMVTCAYDPNDKQAFPQGYEEPHFVLNDTEIEYLVRFQNTGNAAATTVTVRDTLSEHIDLSSFNLRANSHNVLTTVDPATREVLFTFNNIMLPDSTTDEPGSHGLVSYTVRTAPNLPADTRIENTAYIYFDSNPAIVTNTTWHTIYECLEPEELQIAEETLCLGETIMESMDLEFIENYNWTVNNEDYSADAQLIYTPELPGWYDLSVTAQNPLCSTEFTASVFVNDAPEASFTTDGAVLTSIESEEYQWFLNGEEIEGETSMNLTVGQNGEYSVQTTNAEGCSSISEPIFVNVVGVSERFELNLLAFPNPVNNNLTLQLSRGGVWNLDVLDAAGRLIIKDQFNGVQSQIDCSSIAAGTYTLRVYNEEGVKFLPVVVQR